MHNLLKLLELSQFDDPQGYAFVKYDNKESACSAIVALNGTKIGAGPNSVKCSWGKETHAMNMNNGPMAAMAAMAAAHQENAFAPVAAPDAAAAAAAAAAAYYQVTFIHTMLHACTCYMT